MDTEKDPKQEPTTQEGERTFTQEEVNRIVSERLNKDRARNEASLAQREQELQARELRFAAREMLAQKQLDESILDALKYSDEESLERSLSLIDQAINKRLDAANTPKRTISFSAPMSMGMSRPSLDDTIRQAMRRPE